MTSWGTVLLALGLSCLPCWAGDESVDALEEAKKKMELLLRKGEVLEKLGDREGALKLYEEALEVYAKAKGRTAHDPRAQGASRRTGAAVERALEWLARYQDDDGRWDCDDFPKHDPEGDFTGGRGGALYDVGVTGLSLLAFLSKGHTDRGSAAENPYAKNVRMGLRFLMSEQDKEGCFGARVSQHFMYNTAIATAAMCGAYRRTKNPRYREPAQRGLKYLLHARNPHMAWRYTPRGGENDTSVTGWCVFALDRGRRAELVGDDDWKTAMLGVIAWIDKMTDPDFGQVGYTMRGGSVARPEGQQDRFPPEKSQSLTASGVLSRLRAGESAKSEIVQRGIELVLSCAPRWKPDQGWTDLYFWFWGTRACYHVGGAPWKRWNAALKDAVLPHQHGAGAKAGSWDPVGPWGGDGGRVYSTALLALTLQTYAEGPIRR